MKLQTSRFSNTLALAAPGAVLLAGHVAGAADIFLKIEGVDGEAIDTFHKGEIEILSWSWGATNSTGPIGGGAGAGKVSMQSFTITKRLDKSSPALFLRCATGVHFPTVSLRFARPEVSSGEDYYVVTLHDVTVTGIQGDRPAAEPGSTTGGIPTERVSLNFAKIEIHYKPLLRDSSGNPTGALGETVSATVEVEPPPAAP